MDQILKSDREPTGGLRESLVEDIAVLAKKLRTEIHSEAVHFHELGRNAYRWHIGLTAVTVGTSALAAILGGFSFDPRIVGSVALVPGLCAGAADKFRLRSKKNWCYRKYDALMALLRELDFVMPKPATAEDVAKIAKALTKIETDMSAAYEQFEEGQASKTEVELGSRALRAT